VIGGSNKLLSAAETAELLGVHRETLYREWEKWGLRGIRVGRSIKFRERDIESWLARQGNTAS
jgi:excisionase family DNA binding protein